MSTAPDIQNPAHSVGRTEYDVVIAGASLAGSTAAIFYGRAGLRVALLERSSNMTAHKALCGHYILGGTRPTLERAGLWERMIAEGAATTDLGAWTSAGWIAPVAGPDAPVAISLRRSKLDPLVRRVAAETPGVDLFLGHSVTGLVERGDRVVGLVAATSAGEERTFTGRLVVAADGHRSKVAQLAGVAEDSAPNQRFLYWAYYRGVQTGAPGGSQVWFCDPDVAVSVVAGDDLTLVGVFPNKDKLPDFEENRADALERFVSTLTDGPDLSRAERVSKVIGTSDYPCTKRHPTPRPGLALIGDAATSSDPTPAVGAGWAFRTAEMLTTHTIEALVAGHDLRRPLRRYRDAHRLVEKYDKIGRADARAKPANALQRAVRTAAVHDGDVARRLALFANRCAPPSVLLNPRTVLRSLRVATRHRRHADRAHARHADSSLTRSS